MIARTTNPASGMNNSTAVKRAIAGLSGAKKDSRTDGIGSNEYCILKVTKSISVDCPCDSMIEVK